MPFDYFNHIFSQADDRVNFNNWVRIRRYESGHDDALGQEVVVVGMNRARIRRIAVELRSLLSIALIARRHKVSGEECIDGPEALRKYMINRGSTGGTADGAYTGGETATNVFNK